MFQSDADKRFCKDTEPIPGVRLSKAVQFVSANTLSSGVCDELLIDKSTRNWRRWIYYKSKKSIPDLCTNVFGNKILIEKIERACLAIREGHRNIGEDYFIDAMNETVAQLGNPRSDSAEALDRYLALLYQYNIPSYFTNITTN